MKRVVLTSGLREADIRPPALLSEFRRLSVRDAAVFLRDPAQLENASCPACGGGGDKAFDKEGFSYCRCAGCGSVYVSPRPSAAALEEYYAQSEASRFRVEHYSRDTAKARRYHLLCSHALWMEQLANEAGPRAARAYADVETYSPEIFDEMARLGDFERFYSIRPLLPSRTPGVRETADWELPEPLAAISAFEKLEHQHEPLALLRKMGEALAPGGLAFFTTRTISGFDLQMLWDKTPYIFVPEHLNLMSIEGLALLVERAGMELLELSTPGQLDVQLVKHACQADPAIALPPFLDYLLRRRDALAHEDFQAFLQKHRLSSHVRVAARKPME